MQLGNRPESGPASKSSTKQRPKKRNPETPWLYLRAAHTARCHRQLEITHELGVNAAIIL